MYWLNLLGGIANRPQLLAAPKELIMWKQYHEPTTQYLQPSGIMNQPGGPR